MKTFELYADEEYVRKGMAEDSREFWNESLPELESHLGARAYDWEDARCKVTRYMHPEDTLISVVDRHELGYLPGSDLARVTTRGARTPGIYKDGKYDLWIVDERLPWDLEGADPMEDFQKALQKIAEPNHHVEEYFYGAVKGISDPPEQLEECPLLYSDEVDSICHRMRLGEGVGPDFVLINVVDNKAIVRRLGGDTHYEVVLR